MRNASVRYPDTFFPKNALRTASATCEGSICVMRRPSASTWRVSVNETTILPYFPVWRSGTKDQWRRHYRTDPQQPTKSVTLRVQRNFKDGRPWRLPVATKTKKITKWWLKSMKESFKTCIKKLSKSAIARIPIAIVIWKWTLLHSRCWARHWERQCKQNRCIVWFAQTTIKMSKN